jgi:hypothetical protein
MEWVKELIGQTAEQQLRGETSKFNPNENKIERGAVERFFDERFGRAKDIQRLARERQEEELKGSDIGKEIKKFGETPDVNSTQTEEDLVPQLRRLREEESDRLEKKRYMLPQNQETRARVERMENRQIASDLEDKRRFDANQRATIDAQRDTTALGMAQLDITRQQEANRMAEETRRYNERRADSKKERMAAIIAGLANLGGAFVI